MYITTLHTRPLRRFIMTTTMRKMKARKKRYPTGVSIGRSPNSSSPTNMVNVFTTERSRVSKNG